jgi:hypothetical protein
MSSGIFINFVTDAAALPEFFDSTDESDNDNENEF